MNPEYAIASYLIGLGTALVYALWLRRKERVLEEEVRAIPIEVENRPKRRHR